MSTLTVSNIKKTGETASRDVSGVAAAWVHFNGTGTVAIRDSFNLASVTDNGTGDYSPNFVNAMASSNYAAPFSLQIPAVIAGVRVPSTLSTSWKMLCSTTGGQADANPVTAAIHGDLA